MNTLQKARIKVLGGNPDDFAPVFDLPTGWVAGWANGVYYGIDPDGGLVGLLWPSA